VSLVVPFWMCRKFADEKFVSVDEESRGGLGGGAEENLADHWRLRLLGRITSP
jgi:hypothetical protein